VISAGNRPDLEGLVYAPLYLHLFKMPKKLFDMHAGMSEEAKKRIPRREWGRVGALVNFQADDNNIIKKIDKASKDAFGTMAGCDDDIIRVSAKIAFSPPRPDGSIRMYNDNGVDMEGHIDENIVRTATPNVIYKATINYFFNEDQLREEEDVDLATYAPMMDYDFGGFFKGYIHSGAFSMMYQTAVATEFNDVQQLEFLERCPWNEDVPIHRVAVDWLDGLGVRPYLGVPQVTLDRIGFFVDDRELFIPYFPDLVCLCACVDYTENDVWPGTHVIGHVYICPYFHPGRCIMFCFCKDPAVPRRTAHTRDRYPCRVQLDGSRHFLIPVVKKRSKDGTPFYYNVSSTFYIRDPNNLLGGDDKANAWVKLDRVEPGQPPFVVMERE